MAKSMVHGPRPTVDARRREKGLKQCCFYALSLEGFTVLFAAGKVLAVVHSLVGTSSAQYPVAEQFCKSGSVSRISRRPPPPGCPHPWAAHFQPPRRRGRSWSATVGKHNP